MKRIFLVLLSCLMAPPILLTLWAQAGKKASVAILELEPKGVPEVECSALSDRLRSELLNTGAFDVMERGKMQEILKEQGFQQTGACNTDACAVEVGQLIGVQKMIAGSLGKVGKTYTINLRLIDVRTGRIERSVTRDYAGEIDKLLTTEMNQVANILASSVTGQPLPIQTKPAAVSPGKPFYKKWWFYAGLGTVAAGGAAAVLLSKKESSEPAPTVEEIPLPPDRP